eukprot:817268-Prymnesium_polylepis.1
MARPGADHLGEPVRQEARRALWRGSPRALRRRAAARALGLGRAAAAPVRDGRGGDRPAAPAPAGGRARVGRVGLGQDGGRPAAGALHDVARRAAHLERRRRRRRRLSLLARAVVERAAVVARARGFWERVD